MIDGGITIGVDTDLTVSHSRTTSRVRIGTYTSQGGATRITTIEFPHIEINSTEILPAVTLRCFWHRFAFYLAPPISLKQAESPHFLTH